MCAELKRFWAHSDLSLMPSGVKMLVILWFLIFFTSKTSIYRLFVIDLGCTIKIRVDWCAYCLYSTYESAHCSEKTQFFRVFWVYFDLDALKRFCVGCKWQFFIKFSQKVTITSDRLKIDEVLKLLGKKNFLTPTFFVFSLRFRTF